MTEESLSPDYANATNPTSFRAV